MHGNSALVSLYDAMDCLAAIRLRLEQSRRASDGTLRHHEFVADVEEAVSCVRLAIDALEGTTERSAAHRPTQAPRGPSSLRS